MTREELFNDITVNTVNEDSDHYYCMFCDNFANFVVTNNNVIPSIKYPMCIKCAKLFNNKITLGIVGTIMDL